VNLYGERQAFTFGEKASWQHPLRSLTITEFAAQFLPFPLEGEGGAKRRVRGSQAAISKAKNPPTDGSS
jgi:hypothetical protein